MSIEATYSNKEVKAIRNHVAGKHSNIPFLLLPVRIETRFMKVEKPVFSFEVENNLSNIIESMADLDLLVTLPKVKLRAPQQKELVKNIQELTEKAIREINTLDAVNKSQKRLLLEWKSTLEEKVKQIQTDFVPGHLKKIKSTFSQLGKKVDAVNDDQPPISENANTFIEKMIKLRDNMSLFTQQKTPFTSPENKKKLYDFVDGRIEEVKRFYDHSQNRIGNIVYLENGQLEKIKGLHEAIKSHTLRITESIINHHKDKSWKTFVNSRKHYIKNDFPPLFENFEDQAFQYLAKLHQVKPVDANLYLSKSLSLRNSIHKFNQTEQIQYGELKTIRKYVEKKGSLLKKMGTNILHGSEVQKEKITQTNLQLSTSFTGFESRLSRVNIKNRSQKFGIETAKVKIAELKSNLLLSDSLRQTNRTDLVNNLKFLNTVKSTTKKFQKQLINKKVGKGDLTEVQDILKNIKVAIRKKSQFDPEELKTLNTEMRRLALQSREGNFTSNEVKMDFQVAVNNIQNGVRKLEENTLQTGTRPGLQFVNTTKIVNELWLRIYPDDIFVHTHEKQLTKEEVDSGKRYLKTVWAVDEEKDLTIGAWRSLTASYGSKRAAWIVKEVEEDRKKSNGSIQNRNPSRKISESLGRLKNVAELLKTVNNQTRSAALSVLEFDVMTDHLKSVSTIYKTLEHKPQLVFFLQKSITLQQRIYSKLQIIADVFKRDQNFSNREVITEFNKITKIFEEIHGNFSKIIPLRTDQFLEKIKDPYDYNDNLKNKDEYWSVAPHTKVLPKRFVAIARNHNHFEVIHAGKNIPDELQLGMDPSKFQFESENDNPFQLDENGELIVEEGMKWMVDFDESVKKGMGMRIPLSAEQAHGGFDELYVLGVSEDTAGNDTTLFEELLENHHYAPFGMEFLKVGTPTNNTEDSFAGFSSQDIDAEESFRIEMADGLFGAKVNNPFEQPDGRRLAEALGIGEKYFYHINNSNLLQVSNSKAMHKALWHSTIGVYMEDMWDKLFTYDNIERTYKFFTNHVSARGELPSIRIASQPYGILPVTSLSQLSFSDTWNEGNLPTLTANQLKNPSSTSVQNKLQLRYDLRLKQLLKKGEFVWNGLRYQVNHAGNIEKHENPQAAFVNMLGLTATSTEYYFRYGVNINDRSANELTIDTINFDDEVPYSPQMANFFFSNLLKDGYFVPSYEWEDEINPVSDEEKQTTRMNSRIRDQFYASRIFNYRLLNRHSLLNGELVTATPNTKGLPPVANGESYIGWLLNENKHFYFDIFNDNNIQELPSKSLLFLLLRQSRLLSYREAALNILQKDKFFTEPFRRLLGGKESYMGNDFYRFRTKWTHLLKRLSDLNSSFYFDEKNISAKPLYNYLKDNGNESLSDYIHRENFRENYSHHKSHSTYIQRVEEIEQAMRHLDSVTSLDLEKLLAEHLDLCTYRLDAWISGFANKRLKESRKLNKKGIHLGAYAWVENLRPGGERKEVNHIPSGLTAQNEKVYTDEDNEGFIHMPSINHAISAAILRSGYLANDEAEGNLTNRMAVNLSSRRVRKALHLINGLRGGSDLPSLLGYQFERGLHESYHEAELDKFILPFRIKFPLVVPITEQAQEDEKPVHTNVVHGLDLLEAVTDSLTDNKKVSQTSLYDYLTENEFANCPKWLSEFVDKNSGTTIGEEEEEIEEKKLELRAIIRELDQISDAFDALGDVAISESVYQIVNGNHVRAASVLSALADGSVMPDPQVINTPRTGRVVTHRVILNLEITTGNPSNWPGELTPRAKAEPKLNHYIASKLPASNLIRVMVKNRDTEEEYEVGMDELGIQPIDFLFLLSSNKQTGNADLLDLFMDRVRQRESLTSEEILFVDFASRKGSWGSNIQSFYEIELLLQECKNLLHDAKAVGYSDMRIPDENPGVDNPNHINISTLGDRVNLIVGDITQLRNLISDLIAANDTINSVSLANTAIDYLKTAGLYGITNLLANIVRDNNEEEYEILFERLIKANELLTNRIQEANDLQESVVTRMFAYEKAADLQEIVKKVFGENFIIIPVFKHSEKEEVTDQLNLSSSKSLLRASSCTFPMDEWLQGIADVRKKLHAYEMIDMIGNRAGSEPCNIQPVQFPYVDGDYWLGLDFPSDYEAEDDKLSLVLLQPEYATQEDQAGLVIDEWLEIIPYRQETTGITFQYDQPDSTPPQTVLLAVSPKPVTKTSKWDWDHLVYTLIDTFKMARNRTVEPDHIEDSMFGHMLPSMISEVVPPQLLDFEGDDEEVHRNVLGVQAVLDFADNLQEPEEDE